MVTLLIFLVSSKFLEAISFEPIVQVGKCLNYFSLPLRLFYQKLHEECRPVYIVFMSLVKIHFGRLPNYQAYKKKKYKESLFWAILLSDKMDHILT